MEAIGYVKMRGNRYSKETGINSGVFQISVLCTIDIYNLTFFVIIFFIF